MVDKNGDEVLFFFKIGLFFRIRDLNFYPYIRRNTSWGTNTIKMIKTMSDLF